MSLAAAPTLVQTLIFDDVAMLARRLDPGDYRPRADLIRPQLAHLQCLGPRPLDPLDQALRQGHRPRHRPRLNLAPKDTQPMHAHHADFRPSDSSRATHRRAADRVVAEARRANGQPVRVPFAGGTVTAFRAGAKVRFEVVTAAGTFADFNSAGASRAVASQMADA